MQVWTYREAFASRPTWHVCQEKLAPAGVVASVYNESHARLIAAAPELLRELQRVYASFGGECFDWEPVRAAIAKAQVPPGDM